MDPRSGELYRLAMDREADAGEVVAAKEAKAADEETKLKLAELMAEEGGADRPLVLVDESVVQKLRLGEKELRRRRQRRR
ncbi:MAG: hypothetical protein ACRDPE_19725 [Solirubrobacterales bacterium]